jgi:large subunit ribosomal protein L24
MKLKKGDTVIVTLGKDKGKKGKVEKVFPKTHFILVGGVNISKRHMKKRDEKNPGGIVDMPKPLADSKVALVCPKCGKQTRIGYFVNKGEKIRICRKCEQKI